MFDESVRTLLTQHDKLQYTLIVFGNVANTPRSPFCFVSELYIVVRFNSGRRKKLQRKMDVDSSSTVAKVLTIGCLVFSLVGVVLNIIVLAVVRQIRSMHTVTNYLLENVALPDLLTLIWPSNIGSLRVFGPNMDNATGNFLCKFIDFFPLVTMSVSALTLTTLAVERYQGLVKPLSSRFKFNKNISSLCYIRSLDCGSRLFDTIFAVYKFQQGKRKMPAQLCVDCRSCMCCYFHHRDCCCSLRDNYILLF